MNEFGRVRLHPHWHGLVAVYGDFFHIIFRGQSIRYCKILHLPLSKSVRLLNRIRSPSQPPEETFSAKSSTRIPGSSLPDRSWNRSAAGQAG